MKKKILFAAYQSPVGSIWVNEAFRSAFGMVAEELEPSVLLLHEGVVGLSVDTKPELLGLFPLKIVQRYISRYGIGVYAVKEDIERFRVKEIDPGYQAQLVPESGMSDFLHQFDQVIFM